MKLHGIDQLAVVALDHHLVTTEIRCCEQLKSFRNSIELQPVVLPDPQYASTVCLLRRRSVWVYTRDVLKDRIFRIGDTDETILILVPASSRVVRVARACRA